MPFRPPASHVHERVAMALAEKKVHTRWLPVMQVDSWNSGISEVIEFLPAILFFTRASCFRNNCITTAPEIYHSTNTHSTFTFPTPTFCLGLTINTNISGISNVSTIVSENPPISSAAVGGWPLSRRDAVSRRPHRKCPAGMEVGVEFLEMWWLGQCHVR